MYLALAPKRLLVSFRKNKIIALAKINTYDDVMRTWAAPARAIGQKSFNSHCVIMGKLKKGMSRAMSIEQNRTTTANVYY